MRVKELARAVLLQSHLQVAVHCQALLLCRMVAQPRKHQMEGSLACTRRRAAQQLVRSSFQQQSCSCCFLVKVSSHEAVVGCEVPAGRAQHSRTQHNSTAGHSTAMPGVSTYAHDVQRDTNFERTRVTVPWRLHTGLFSSTAPA